MTQKIEFEDHISLYPDLNYVVIPRKVMDQLQVKADKDTRIFVHIKNVDSYLSEKKYKFTIEPSMEERITFEGVIETVFRLRQPLVIIPQKEIEKVMWCHLGTKVKVTIEPSVENPAEGGEEKEND